MAKNKDTDNDWEITGSTVTDGYMLGVLLTGGAGVVVPPTKRYTVENTETGERRTVLSDSREGVGRKISEGKFEKKKK